MQRLKRKQKINYTKAKTPDTVGSHGREYGSLVKMIGCLESFGELALIQFCFVCFEIVKFHWFFLRFFFVVFEFLVKQKKTIL